MQTLPYQYHHANPTLSTPLCKPHLINTTVQTPPYQHHCAKPHLINTTVQTPPYQHRCAKPHLINTIVQTPTLSAPIQRPRLQSLEGKDGPTHHNVNSVSGKTTACDGEQCATPKRPPEGRQVRNHWQQSKPPICITGYRDQCIATVTNTQRELFQQCHRRWTQLADSKWQLAVWAWRDHTHCYIGVCDLCHGQTNRHWLDLICWQNPEMQNMHFHREKNTSAKRKLYKVLRNHNHLPSKTMIMQESSAVSGKMRPEVLVWNQQTKLGLPRALLMSHIQVITRDTTETWACGLSGFDLPCILLTCQLTGTVPDSGGCCNICDIMQMLSIPFASSL